MGSVTVVLLSGGDKSSQRQDIKSAQDLWEKFEAEGLSEDQLILWNQGEALPPADSIGEQQMPQPDKGNDTK